MCENSSRVSLSKELNLKKSTVSDNIKSLLEEQWIMESTEGPSSEKGGRRPIYLKFNPQAATIISMIVENNTIAYSLSYLDGNIIISDQKKFQNNIEFIAEVKDIIEYLSNISNKTPHGILNVTISINGVVHNNNVVFTPYSHLDQLDIVEELRTISDFPVYIINEANASVIGEHSFSPDLTSLATINIDEGVGAGVILNNSLFIGYEGRSGEIGHTTIVINGRPCPCGNRGCLEQYVSQRRILEECGYENLNDLVSAWRKGDESVKMKVTNAMQWLGVAINNFATLFDLEKIFLHSNFFNELPELKAIVLKELKGYNTQKIQLVISDLSSDSKYYGLIAFSVMKSLGITRYKFQRNLN